MNKVNLLIYHKTSLKVRPSRGLLGVTVNQTVAASREGSLESGAGAEATSSTPRVSSRLRSNLVPLTAHQVGGMNVSF